MTTYFITICAHMQQNLFQRDDVAELLVATLMKDRDAGEFELHEFVVMPNHVHLLLSMNHQNLGRVIQFIKGGFSHSLREHGIAFRAVWEQRYHDRRVRDENEFTEFRHYIRQNPVRKGLAERPEDYPYSSASLLRLKPLETNKRAADATLKGGSTSHCVLDANLKVRSTSNSDTGNATGAVTSNANLKARSTRPYGADTNITARSKSESDTKCTTIS